MIKITESGFEKEIEKIRVRAWAAMERPEPAVKKIISAVKKSGDRAVADFTARFTGVKITPADFEVSKKDWHRTAAGVSPENKKLISYAAASITRFHQSEIPRSWLIKKDGKILGRRFTPIEKVGLYVPGGRALYPSTVLMNAIPARIAGVPQIIMVTPVGAGGRVAPEILYAAKIAGVHRVFKIGGAQAVAALAFGTKYIPRVDKVVGPGNIYVTLAKKLLFGTIGIDGLAGPSELLIIAEEPVNPNYLAVDLLAQAEHDPQAGVWLVTTSHRLADAVNRQLPKILKMSGRAEITRTALKNARIFLVKNLEEAYDLSNSLAPEHLEIIVRRPDLALEKIKNAGAIFVGPYTPNSAGDYLAGPSHTLPTSGTAHFSSGLGVADFVKNSSVIYYSEKAIKKEADLIQRFATLEGLPAHAISALVRKVL